MILVDISHLFFRQFFMSKKSICPMKPDPTDPNKQVYTGEVNGGFLAHVIFQSVLALSKKFGASEDNELIICCDSKPSWRHEYYVEHSKAFPEYDGETYKGDRTKDDDGTPWDGIWEAFEDAMIALDKCTDFQVIKVDRAEADDIIAVLARECERQGKDAYVCSSDKDFRQLQTNKIHIYDPIKKIMIPPLDTERYKKLHFLVAGDDNIKQCRKGIGDKTAEKMLKDLDKILATDPELRARYEFNQNLIDFDYIPKDVGDAIRAAYVNSEHLNHSPATLLSFFSEKRMAAMAARIPEFRLRGKAAKRPKISITNKDVAAEADASIEAFFE